MEKWSCLHYSVVNSCKIESKRHRVPTLFYILMAIHTKFQSTSTQTGQMNCLQNSAPNPDQPVLYFAHSQMKTES